MGYLFVKLTKDFCLRNKNNSFVLLEKNYPSLKSKFVKKEKLILK